MDMQTKYIKSNGLKLAYKRWERGKTEVLFLPGYLSTMKKLNKTDSKISSLQKVCVEKGFSFTAFDYSGTGESEGSFQQWNVENWIINIQDIVTKVLKYKSVVLVGSSMGGYLSLFLPTLFLDRIKTLIAVVPGFGKSFFEETHKCVLKDNRTGLSIKLKLDEENKPFIDSNLDIKCPVHLIRALKDDVVSSFACQSIVDHLPDSTFKKRYDVDVSHSGIDSVKKLIQVLEGVSTFIE